MTGLANPPQPLLGYPGSDNLFRDLAFPEHEAQNLLLRADLALQVERFVKLTRAEAAKRLGVTQPRLNQLLRGKLSDFSLDVLVNMLAYAAMRVDVKCGRSRKV